MKVVCTPHQEDIRIGMIAPAIPGVNTFKSFNSRTLKTEDSCREQNIPSEKNTITRIVIGYKKDDFALKKWIFSKKLGATSLGNNSKTKKKTEIEWTKDKLVSSNTEVIDFDFKDSNYKDAHGLYYYMQNEKTVTDFLNALF